MPFDATPIPAATTALMNGRQKLVVGWCQKVMRERNAVCMFGSLHDTLGDDTYTVAEELLTIAIREMGVFLSIPDFNDHPSRTKAEVLAVFDRAIELSWST